MAEHQYYPEEVLIEKMERGEYGWLDYVNHFSAEWQEEYTRYCKEHGLMLGNEPAADFVHTKTSNWKRRWRTKMHNGNLFNNGLWRYERIPTPE